MYDSQTIAFMIKKTAKEKNIAIKQLLETCNLNINTISELSKGKQISYTSFATIAECLGVSTDYLLGREDSQKSKTEIPDSDKSPTDDFKDLSAEQWQDLLKYVQFLRWQKKAS